MNFIDGLRRMKRRGRTRNGAFSNLLIRSGKERLNETIFFCFFYNILFFINVVCENQML